MKTTLLTVAACILILLSCQKDYSATATIKESKKRWPFQELRQHRMKAILLTDLTHFTSLQASTLKQAAWEDKTFSADGNVLDAQTA